MGKARGSQTSNGVVKSEGSFTVESVDQVAYSARNIIEKELGLPACRVCQCAESDKRGDVALEFLGIYPPLQESHKSNEEVMSNSEEVLNVHNDSNVTKQEGMESGFVEFISPDGEVFICKTDIEMGSLHHHDILIELGCSCKNDLGLVHYSCALKWFVNRGSTICEICGSVAKNVKNIDIVKIVTSLKDYEALRERTASGEPNPTQVLLNSSIDPDAIAAVRRQRLTEISLWFSPHNNHNNANNSAIVSQFVYEQPLNIVMDDAPPENPARKWAVEATGILLATGLLTVTLAWLIAPRVGMKTAKSGYHILLGGVCALAVVLFFRIVVLTRIKYGPARYWAILFVFWLLVFAIWASRTRNRDPN